MPSQTSPRLCDGISLAIPTAIPCEPFASKFGNFPGNKKHEYKQQIEQSILDFLEDSCAQNAFKVFQSFFNAYWIGTNEDQNPFLELINKMKSYEETSGVLIPKHRDHYTHSVYVFILGLIIYSKNEVFRKMFDKSILKSSYLDAYKTKHEEFFYRWGIASLFHDIAYPLEISIKQINVYVDFISHHSEDSRNDLAIKMSIDNIDDFNSLPQIVPLPEFSAEFIKKYPNCEPLNLSDSIDLLSHKLNTSFGIDIMKSRAGLNNFAFKMQEGHFIDHGYYSALIVLRWYYFLIQKERWNPVYFYYPIVDSASAILLHNYYRHVLMKEPFYMGKLNAESHPIAFLLMFCDELQDWNRMAYGVIDKRLCLPIDFDIKITNKTFELTYIANETEIQDYLDKKFKVIDETLQMKPLFEEGIKLDLRKRS